MVVKYTNVPTAKIIISSPPVSYHSFYSYTINIFHILQKVNTKPINILHKYIVTRYCKIPCD